MKRFATVPYVGQTLVDLEAVNGVGTAALTAGLVRFFPGNFLLVTAHVTLGNEVRTVVPEPGSAALLGLGLVGLACVAGGQVAMAARKSMRRS